MQFDFPVGIVDIMIKEEKSRQQKANESFRQLNVELPCADVYRERIQEREVVKEPRRVIIIEI